MLSYFKRILKVCKLYSSVPNRSAGTFINFKEKFQPARSHLVLHVYWFLSNFSTCPFMIKKNLKYLLTLKSLIDEQIGIGKQTDIFWKIYKTSREEMTMRMVKSSQFGKIAKQAGLNKQAERKYFNITSRLKICIFIWACTFIQYTRVGSLFSLC